MDPCITEQYPSTAAPLEQASAQQPYKYKYELFEGFAGERYLESLAQKFAPLAIFRTWWASVSYQAPGESCYVGVTRLIDERAGDTGIHIGVGERKAYLDFEALIARGWLVIESVQKPFRTKEGNIVLRVVPEKDFSGFYDAAYDYHQWLSDPGYIPPARKHVPLMLTDAAVTERLIRFENYRRLLVNAKPGRKPRLSQQDFYRCQLEKVAHKGEENGQDLQDGSRLNLYLNTLTNTDSTYRRPRSDDSTSDKEMRSEDSTSLEEEEGVAAKTIRKLNTRSSAHDSNSEPPTPEEAQRGEVVKEVTRILGYTEAELKQDSNKRGAAMAGIPADQYAKLNGGQDQAEREETVQRQQETPWLFEEQPEPTLPARPEREVPPMVIEEGRHYARQYDDPHLVSSDITRFKKLYSAASQAVAGFDEKMYWERYDGAKSAAAKRASKSTNSKGYVTRVPYLFTCLENSFAFSLEEMVYLRSDDALSSDCTLFEVIDNMRVTYHSQVAMGQTDIEYRTWLCGVLDSFEKCKEPKERLNATTRPYPCESPARL